MRRVKNNKLSALFKSIIKLGIIEEKHSLNEAKRIELLNTYTLIWIHFSVMFVFLNIISRPTLLNIISASKTKMLFDLCTHLLAIVISITIFILNKKKQFKIAKLLFIGMAYLVFFALTLLAEKNSHVIIYFALIPLLALSLYKKITIAVVLLFVCLITTTWIDAVYKENFTIAEITQNILFLKDVVVTALFFSLFFLVLYFKKLNIKNEAFLERQRDKVLDDKIKIEKQEAKLRELNEFKTHFFVNLSHEIRTPVTLIKGYASKIDFNQTKQENEPKLAIVNRQVAQIENIINNILDLSKLDENKLQLHRNNIDIISFLNKHYAEFKALFTKKNIAFSFTNTIANSTVYMDTNLVAKAMTNLLSNALKFTQEGGKVSITVSQEKDIYIKVVDDGLGVPETDIERIFERFYQSKNHITKSQGSGIGLSFSKSILEAHGFRIAVKSTPNVNTTFTITIPEQYISIPEATPTVVVPTTPQNIKAPLPNTPTITKDAPTLLIVDDHLELRQYLKTVLNTYTIIEAENGEEALNIIKNNTTINMVVTDYMMPKMDGKELVLAIKNLHINIPILMLTARIDDVAKLDMLRIGVDNYMIKPFIDEELLLSVANALKTYQKIIANQETLSIEEKEELYAIDENFHVNIRKIIEKNISDFNFGIDTIALLFKTSKSTLNRKIKNSLGQTTKELIMQAKVEKAREFQLSNSKMTKKDIANAVGIKNTTYLFNKLAETYGSHYN